jgi:putative membrane protein
VTAAAPSDPGLQPERTLLAWRRTCLGLAVASAVAIRLATTPHGRAAVILGGTALILSGAGWIIATRRYVRAHRDLTAAPSTLGHDGTMVAITAAATVLLGLAAIALIAAG